MNTMINLWVAWLGFFGGIVSGALMGLQFWRDGWLGGYAAWARRMVRLAHISFFGIGFLNFAFFMTTRSLHGTEMTLARTIAGAALCLTAVLMPLVCYLSAWRKPLRQLFPLPVICATAGVAGTLWLLTTSTM